MSEISDDYDNEQPMHSSQKNGKKKKSPSSFSRFQFQSISDSEEETYDHVNDYRMSKQVCQKP